MTDIASQAQRLVEAVNQRDVSVADEVFARDCVVHITGRTEPIAGIGAWKEHAGAILTAFSDVHFTIEEIVTTDDIVATRWTGRGTHDGPFGPIPATGKPFSIVGLILDHFVDGKISVRWEQYDQSLFLQQIGVQ
jgi:steroid delta-isomerase-like uncharacterized protein